MHVCSVLAASNLGEDHFVSRQLVKFFWLDSEYNIPSWFSSSLLWLSGVLLIAIAFFVQTERRNYSAHWMLLGFAFLVISMDEAIAVHEWLIEPVRAAFNTTGIFYFAWIIPAAVVLIVGLVAYIPFLRYLPDRTRSIFVNAGILYVSGAIGMEMIGGAAHSGEISRSFYQIAMPIEEMLEMCGIILFIYGLVAFIFHDSKAPRLRET